MSTVTSATDTLNSADEAYWMDHDHCRPSDHPMVRAFTEPRIQTMCQIIGSGRKKTLLDAGTGTGIFLCPLNKLFDADGIDTSKYMLSKNPLRDKCRRLDAARTGLPDAAYDIVFEANMLHHVPDASATVQELSRVAGEWLVLLEPNRYNPVMAGLALWRRGERKALRSTRRYLRSLVKPPFEVVHLESSGMIAPNRIPTMLLPGLRLLDFSSPFGMFIFLIARRMPWL